MSSVMILTGASRALADVGTAGGGPLLRQNFGPRSLALGQAYVSLADDAFSLSYNPAGLSRLSQTHVAAQYTNGLLDQQFGYMAMATPLNPRHAVALSLATFSAGKLDVYDDSGRVSGSKSAQSDRLVHLGYSFAVRETSLFPGALHLGAAGRLLQSSLLEETKATAYALDLGALYQHPLSKHSKFNAALAVANIGPAVQYRGGMASGSSRDPLPRTIRAGASYQRAFLSDYLLTVSAEADRMSPSADAQGALGVEYLFLGLFSLRAGYRMGQDPGSLSVGGGVRWLGADFNYGVRPGGPIGQVHQVSFSYRFSMKGLNYPGPSLPESPRMPSVISPFEALFKQLEEQIAQGRHFAAMENIQKILIWFPESERAKRDQLLINDKISADLRGRVDNPARYFYALAFKSYWNKEWNGAAAAIKQAMELDPANTALYRYYAGAVRQSKERNRIGVLEDRVRIAEIYDQALQAFDQGNYARSLDHVEQILNIQSYPPASYLKRKIHMAMAPPVRTPSYASELEPGKPKPEPVEEEPEAEVSRKDIELSRNLYYDAMREYARGSLQQAIAKLQQALSLNPTNVEVGNILLRIQRER